MGWFAYNGRTLDKAVQLENLRVVLVRTRNPLNIGAAARAMSNFGAFHLRLVTPYEKAFREAVSAVGAAQLLARAEEFDSLAEATRDCSLVVGTTAVENGFTMVVDRPFFCAIRDNTTGAIQFMGSIVDPT